VSTNWSWVQSPVIRCLYRGCACYSTTMLGWVRFDRVTTPKLAKSILNPNPSPPVRLGSKKFYDLQPSRFWPKLRVTLTLESRPRITMASLRGLSRPARSLPLSQLLRQTYTPAAVRCASSQAAEAAAPVLRDLENSTLAAPQLSEEEKKEFRPWKRAKDRKFALPSGR
jgi:hypothetical protein